MCTSTLIKIIIHHLPRCRSRADLPESHGAIEDQGGSPFSSYVSSFFPERTWSRSVYMGWISEEPGSSGEEEGGGGGGGGVPRRPRAALAPFLEEADPLAPTVGAPEVAAAARAEAAVVGPVIAVAVATHARPPVHRDPRGTSIARLRKSREDFFLPTTRDNERHTAMCTCVRSCRGGWGKKYA